MGSLVLGALVDEFNQRMLTSFDYNSEFIRIGNSDIPKLESPSEKYARKLQNKFDNRK